MGAPAAVRYVQSLSVKRRGAALAAGTGATLLLGAWVSAAGPVGVFARQDFSGTESKAPGKELASGAVTGGDGEGLHTAAPSPAATFLVGVVEWTMKLVLVLVVLAVLVALARTLLERWRAQREVVPDGVDDDLLPEVLLEGVREGEALISRGTPANAVISAWVALEDAVRSVGVPDDDTRTAAELVQSVLRRHAVRQEPLDVLAALYREARFSQHPVEEAQRSAAREALQQVQADLRAVVHRAPASRA